MCANKVRSAPANRYERCGNFNETTTRKIMTYDDENAIMLNQGEEQKLTLNVT